ncbi:hypothetical protein M5689_003900 [Euphorbia peplus]|nr:hypothetical protein M5689_003900 [Euphorbia peplus]
MELFTKTKAVTLRSHLDKYLIAHDDGETVSQSRNGSTRKAKWFVELVDGRTDVVRLKSFAGKYLTASDIPFLLGMTGKRVIQTLPEKISDWSLEWEPIKDGFQIKMRSWCGKFLRANGGTPPWRNTVTHDEPHTGSTVRWVLWDVEPVEAAENESLMEYLVSMSSFSSVPDDVLEAAASDEYLGSEPGSPISPISVFKSVRTRRFSVSRTMSPRLSPKKSTTNPYRTAMDLFNNAKAVRLRGHHDKYLHAEDDEESITQDRNGSSKNSKWVVEHVPGSDSIIRLKSCYGKYLTASNQPFLLGMTGRKALQTLPRRLDSSLEWEPVRDGAQVKLKTRYGNYLRANGGLPPWRNSVTHDIPHRTSTQDWILWDVDIVEIEVKSSRNQRPDPPEIQHSDSLDFDSSSSPSSASVVSGSFSRQESTESNVSSPPKSEGRIIYYHVADEFGDFDDELGEAYSLHFKGTGVEELTRKLREETGLYEIIVCSRSPLNGKLYPLRLQLPPNNADMHVVVVESSSKVAKEFMRK